MDRSLELAIGQLESRLVALMQANDRRFDPDFLGYHPFERSINVLIDNLDQHSSVFWAIAALVEAQGFCGRYPDPTRRAAFSMTRFLALHLLGCEGQALWDQRGDSSVPCVSFTSKHEHGETVQSLTEMQGACRQKLELADAAQLQPPHQAQLC